MRDREPFFGWALIVTSTTGMAATAEDCVKQNGAGFWSVLVCLSMTCCAFAVARSIYRDRIGK